MSRARKTVYSCARCKSDVEVIHVFEGVGYCLACADRESRIASGIELAKHGTKRTPGAHNASSYPAPKFVMDDIGQEPVMDDIEPAPPVHISYGCPCGRPTCKDDWHAYAVWLGTDHERWALHFSRLEKLL